MKGMRFPWIAMLAIGAVFGMVSLSSAYVLKGVHVLDLMVTALSHAKTLQINQLVKIEDPEISEAPVSISETLSYAFPNRFRSDSQFELTSRISIVSHGAHLTVIDGRWKTENANRFDRYKDLLLYQSRPLLVKVLLTHGVDVGTTSLGRFNDRIVYVIGAQYPDLSRPQVWVEKDRFLPVRWLDVVENDPAETIEFVYKNWFKNNGQWYPKQIETYYHARLFRTIELKKILVDPTLSNDLWNIDQLKNTYLPEETTSLNDADSDDVGELQQAIESFQKKFDP